MIGPQWFADPVVLIEPLPEVDHLAARGTKWAERFREEIVLLFKNGTLGTGGIGHAMNISDPDPERFAQDRASLSVAPSLGVAFHVRLVNKAAVVKKVIAHLA